MSASDQDVSGPVSEQFCPPPEGSIQRWLGRIVTEVGGPVVEMQGVPRIREPSREPWATKAASEGFDIDSFTPTVKIVSFVLDRETAKAVGGVAPAQPGRNFRFCLEAAYFHRIAGWSPSKIGDYLRLARQGDVRNVRRIIARGDSLWAALGAWPWALYGDGRLPPKWRLDPLVARELASWHEHARGQATMRLVRDAGRLRRARLRASKP